MALRGGSNQLMAALAGLRAPRPQMMGAPSDQADVYASRGIYGDAMNAWQTLQGREEAGMERGHKARMQSAALENALRERAMVNQGQLDVTGLQQEGQTGRTRMELDARRGENEAERGWRESKEFPHQMELEKMRGDRVVEAARARAMRPVAAPKVTADKSHSDMMSVARDLRKLAAKWADSSAQYGEDPAGRQFANGNAQRLEQLGAAVDAQAMRYMIASSLGDKEAAMEARQMVAWIMDEASRLGGPPSSGRAAAPAGPAAAAADTMNDMAGLQQDYMDALKAGDKAAAEKILGVMKTLQ